MPNGRAFIASTIIDIDVHQYMAQDAVDAATPQRQTIMGIPLQLIGTARSADFARTAADRRRDPFIERCRRRLLGLFTVEQACAPCHAGMT